MANTNAPMPTYVTPFLKEDGRVNEPWYRFLFQLQQRTGGSAGSNFVTQAQLDATNAQVTAQELEINGFYPDTPYLPDDLKELGSVQFPIGTMALQNADSVAITGGSIDGTTIGAGIPSSGAFTTVTATTPIGIASGGTGANTAAGARTNLGLGTMATQNANAVAITGGAIDGTTVGATTAASGKFTTLQATSTITPSSTAGIVGTTTNDNANAGSFGEYQSASATGASLTSGNSANAVSFSLSAGDWDVMGVCTFVPAGGTTITVVQSGVNTVSATNAAANTGGFNVVYGTPPAGQGPVLLSPLVRLSLSTTTTVYLVVAAQFSGSTCTASGFIRARRVR
jgi:hypothetical protein